MPDFVPVKSSYTGSKLFEPLANKLDFPIDRLNFLIAQAAALFLAFSYRRITSRGKYSYEARLLGTLVPGLLIGIFAYGRDTFHILLLGLLGYSTTVLTDSRNVQRVTMLVAFMYLSKVHLMRMIYDYGGYILDITGPAMIATQKITSLAFNIHDGLAREDKELSDEQRKYAIRKKPTLLEYFSYVFSFQTVMCGPLVYYNDYIDFITEENYRKHSHNTQESPSPSSVVLSKLGHCFCFAVMVLIGQPWIPIEALADDKFLSDHSFVYIVVYMILCTSAARYKYYLAWKLGETVSNFSGLGFDGHNEDGTESWGMMTNNWFWKYELSLNFKTMLDGWNITTGSWLRRCVYERTSSYRTTLTFTTSALWHGFWPGYYVTFLSGAMFTEGARKGRRLIRPFFVANRAAKLFYDVITFIMTRIYVGYVSAPFVLLSLESTLKLYSRLYFFCHIPCLFAILFFPAIGRLIATEKPISRNEIKNISIDAKKAN
ncbi:Lysophospholipid acyltransferase 1 [Halotydeus destructor]|nr:Lysophospholipid acyltransferase 1 [Halotydeus destructor]